MKLKARRYKIAITGTARSGKTVLLVSLINHLIVPGKFKPHPNWDIRRWNELSAKWTDRFDYNTHRDKLAHNKWPQKTKDVSRFSLWFDRADWNWRNCRVDLLDIPGERMADAAIATCSSYEEWSDHIFKVLDQEATEALVNKYYDVVLETDLTHAPQGETRATVLHAYKELLAQLHQHYVPVITPSVFLLDSNGDPLDVRCPDKYLKRPVGLPDQEFAPLRSSVRAKNTELTKKFSRHFHAYKKGVVMPLFAKLADCHSLAILVDVPSLLAGGPGRFNSTQSLLEEFVSLYRPNGAVGRIWRSMGFSTARVACVATKSDLVSANSTEQNKLRTLLCEISHYLGMKSGLETKNFLVSAVKSTKIPIDSNGDGYLLQGRLLDASNPNAEEKKFMVSALPESWAEAWEAETVYTFPRVHPPIPKSKISPPNQSGLDTLFGYLTDTQA